MIILDQKSRAQLRRYEPEEVPGAHVWAKAVQKEFPGIPYPRLLAVTPVISNIRDKSSEPLGKLLKRAGVTERRVRRLLASDREDIAAQLTRVIRQIGGMADPLNIARIQLFWGDREARQIAMDYFSIDDDTPSVEAHP
jgi:hypothetical protein